MQAAYRQALCLRKSKSYFLRFSVNSYCVLLPSKMFKISFYAYPRDNGENNDNDDDNDKEFI